VFFKADELGIVINRIFILPSLGMKNGVPSYFWIHPFVSGALFVGHGITEEFGVCFILHCGHLMLSLFGLHGCPPFQESMVTE
jgi:hypothetical protein